MPVSSQIFLSFPATAARRVAAVAGESVGRGVPHGRIDSFEEELA